MKIKFISGRTPKETVIPFIQEFNYIAPADLEEILETLDDNHYLSKKGSDFRTELWRMFIFKKTQ